MNRGEGGAVFNCLNSKDCKYKQSLLVVSMATKVVQKSQIDVFFKFVIVREVAISKYKKNKRKIIQIRLHPPIPQLMYGCTNKHPYNNSN